MLRAKRVLVPGAAALGNDLGTGRHGGGHIGFLSRERVELEHGSIELCGVTFLSEIVQSRAVRHPARNSILHVTAALMPCAQRSRVLRRSEVQ